MFGKIKKIFFTGVFGVLYVSYIAQFVYVLAYLDGYSNKLVALGLLSVEWLVLIAARYLSKRSSNSAHTGAGVQNRGNGFRRH